MLGVTAIALLVLAVASLNMERLMPIVTEVSIELQTTSWFAWIADLVAGK